jgi:hypothetical protein
MRWPFAVVLAAQVAEAQPVTVNVNGPLSELATQLSASSPCRFMALGTGQVNLAMTNVSTWDVLAKLEAQHGIHSRLTGGTIFLEPNPRPSSPNDPMLTWAKDWQRHRSWAIAYAPGPRYRMTYSGGGGPPPDERHARILLLGTQGYVIDKVVIERASAGKTTLSAETSIVTPSPWACDPATIDLTIKAAKSISTASVRGHVVVKLPRVAERRVAIPFNDDVVDIAEGRLRVHVASRPRGAGDREVYVSWDGMGEPTVLRVKIVDDKGQPVVSKSNSSSSSTSQGRETRVIAWSSGTLYAVVTLPTKAAPLEEKIPFRFDNVVLDKPGP